MRIWLILADGGSYVSNELFANNYRVEKNRWNKKAHTSGWKRKRCGLVVCYRGVSARRCSGLRLSVVVVVVVVSQQPRWARHVQSEVAEAGWMKDEADVNLEAVGEDRNW